MANSKEDYWWDLAVKGLNATYSYPWLCICSLTAAFKAIVVAMTAGTMKGPDMIADVTMADDMVSMETVMEVIDMIHIITEMETGKIILWKTWNFICSRYTRFEDCLFLLK